MKLQCLNEFVSGIVLATHYTISYVEWNILKHRVCYIGLWMTFTGYGFRRCDLEGKLHVLSTIRLVTDLRTRFIKSRII